VEKGMVPSYCVSLPHYLLFGVPLHNSEIPFLHICIFNLWIAVTYLRQTDYLALLNSMKYLKMVNGKKFLMVFSQTKIG
jgi:hypothetical protein